MKFGGQGIFDNAVFLVGTSARKPGFPRLYKTKDHELSRIPVFVWIVHDGLSYCSGRACEATLCMMQSSSSDSLGNRASRSYLYVLAAPIVIAHWQLALLLLLLPALLLFGV
jgi:hypothetical protein